jgi:PAS domain S-box-containing protein
MAVLGEGANEVYVSPHVEQMLGFTQKEWLENPFLWYRQLHPDDRILWNDEFAKGCRRGGPFRAECRFFARDGHVVWVLGEARVVKDDLGRPQFLQGVAFDITDSKRAQELMLNKAIEDARIKEEMDIARRVQTSVLPRSLDVPGYKVAAVMHPAEDVGGDYYELVVQPDGCWAAIGDVVGHGLKAGLLMLMVQSSMAALLRAMSESEPSEILRDLNEVLFENINDRMSQDSHVTLTLARIRSNGRFSYSGAHEDILVLRQRSGRVSRIATPGTWLGLSPDAGDAFVDTSFQLHVGDVVLLHTDGMREARGTDGEEFGLLRMTRILEENKDADPDDIVKALMDDWNRYKVEQDDDVSLMVLKYVGTSPD